MQEQKGKDYQGLDLENTCFDRQDLCKANFSHSNLNGSTFKNSILRSANFSNADIRGCDFSDSILVGANFENALAGMSEERVANLIFSSLGIAALIGISAVESGSDAAAYIDNSRPSEAISGLILTSLFSLAGSALFGGSLYKTWGNDDYVSNTLCIMMSIACLIICAFSSRHIAVLLRRLSSTSFQNSDLSGARFNNATIKNTDFSGSIQRDLDGGETIVN